MGEEPWAIPVGTLAGLSVLALIFVWWWFPRTWKKGTQQELEILAEQGRINKQREDGSAENLEDKDTLQKPPKTFVYTPQPIATY